MEDNNEKFYFLMLLDFINNSILIETAKYFACCSFR